MFCCVMLKWAAMPLGRVDQLKHAIHLGVGKFNVNIDVRQAFTNSLDDSSASVGKIFASW
jgi:fructose/tagatose bisphosphate aldolase